MTLFAPAFLLLTSLAAVALSFRAWGDEGNGPLLLSLICAFAAALLLIRAALRPRRARIVVDGSNVLHWRDGNPDLATVARVVEALKKQGLEPVVWFDANVGYKVGNRYLGPGPLSRALGLAERYVFVAPKGTPADPLLLHGASRLNARVVTNDRFRDGAGDYPRVNEPGFLMRGRVTAREVTLTQ